MQRRSRGCLFIPPERARGSSRSILGRYWCCYSSYLFLNPLAADIPPIGEGLISQYSLPILVTAALIKKGSYCSSWVHLYTRLIAIQFHPLLQSQFLKPQDSQVINFQIFERSFRDVDLPRGLSRRLFFHAGLLQSFKVCFRFKTPLWTKHFLLLAIYLFYSVPELIERLRPEPSCALVLAAFMTAELADHKGLRENRPCSNNQCRRGHTPKTHTPRLQTLNTQNTVCVFMIALNHPQQLWPLCRGMASTSKFLL